MQRILITGANRGIGFDLTQRYLQRADTLIFATCRHPDRADALQDLAAQYPQRLYILPLDVTDEAAILRAIAAVRSQVDGLELLVNNAGSYPGGVDAQEASSAVFGTLEMQAMLEVFQVNTIAPVILAQAAADLLRSGSSARIVNVTSDAGSITYRDNGCNYSYPASKAALNMMTRCLAGDFRAAAVSVISIHPGWIQTEMGGTHAPRTLADTMPGMMRVIDGLTLADSGSFFNWDGTRVPW
ncbi:MAG: SDR family oxidoreductase [Chloroflexota bacterium]